MRFDVDSAIRAHERRKVETVARAMVDIEFERRVIAAFLADDVILRCGLSCCEGPDTVRAWCSSESLETSKLELEDFTDLRYRAIFVAIRALQARNAEGDPLDVIYTVAAEIRRRDGEAGKHVADTVDEVFLMRLVQDEKRFNGHALAYALRCLRELANVRRQA